MNKSYRKNILRTIRGTASRFWAIFAIVALGVGFLAGLLASTPDMRYSGDLYFDNTRLFDLRIAGTLGLTDGDLEALEQVEGVKSAMAAYSADMLVETAQGDVVVTRIHSLPEGELDSGRADWINQFELIEGRMPENPGECLVEHNSDLTGDAAEIGDRLVVSADNKDPEDTLARMEYEVVGIVESSYYFSYEREPASVGNGSVGMVLYIPQQDFSLDVYTDIYLSVTGAAALEAPGAAYEALVDEVGDRIEEISGERCEIRLAEIRDEAQAELDDGWAEYNDAKAEADKEFADARAELDDGWAELAEGEAELADAEEKLTDARNQLISGEAALKENEAKLPDTLAEQRAPIDEGWAALEAGKQELDDSRDQLETYRDQLAQAQQGLALLEQSAGALTTRLNDLKAQLDQAKADANYDALAAALAAAEAELAAHGGYDAWYATDPAAADAALTARDAAQTAFDGAKQAVAPYQAAVDEASGQLDALNGQISSLSQTVATLEAGIAAGEQGIAAGEEEIAAREAQLNEAEAAFAAAEQEAYDQIAAAKEEIRLGWLEILDGQTEIDDARAELEDGRVELEDGEAEYAQQKADADAELAEARAELEDGEAELEDLELPEWYILDRETNVSYASFKSNIEKVEAVAKVFPIFFFLVAALVVLTTMTRMVDEERLQIGTMKALGYGKGAIVAKYLIYALVASVLGSAAGLAIGLTVLPSVIWNAYEVMYRLPRMYCLFHPTFSLVSAGALILCTLAATLSACWASLHEQPASLMLPRAPKAGKRILLERVGFFWRRLKFTYKVTARNLFRYKKRFFMTVIGISGCTALLVTGFGLHDSISDIVNRQFGEIFTYNLSITLSEEKDLSDPDLRALLRSDQIESWMPIHQEESSNTYGNDTFKTYLYVPQDYKRIDEIVDLHTRLGQEPVTLTGDGIVITEKMSERTGKGIGDTIELQNGDKKTGTFTITGVVENYVENYVYLTADLYAEQFGEQPEYTMIAATTADNSQQARDELSAELFELDCVSGVSFTEDLKTTFSSMMQKIDTIVVVIIFCAGLLAFVVLYNLTNINITEREKEIATIKVLGFFDREVDAYVYRESIALAVIGTLVGLVLGVYLHMFVIHTVEVDAVMFGRSIRTASYLFSALLTLVFALLVNLVMHRKLKQISMVESMKAPE